MATGRQVTPVSRCSVNDVIKIRDRAIATITNALVKGTERVQDLVDCADPTRDADRATIVNLTNQLSTPYGGAASRPGVNHATIII